MMNTRHNQIAVNTTEPSKVMYNGRLTMTQNNKTWIFVERSKEPLQITVSTDSLEKEIILKPRNSFAFWSNIVFNYGIGMLVDKNNPKRYTYPKNVYVNSSDTFPRIFRTPVKNIYNKGDFFVNLSIPHVNAFLLKPEAESYKANAGFWGVAVGMDYYYSPKHFINASAFGIMDIFIPFPAPVTYAGEHEFMSSMYVAASHNHQIKNFTIGYGLSYSRNSWDLRNYGRLDPPEPSRDPVKKAHNAWGFVLPVSYKFYEQLGVGLTYRPTFFRPALTQKFAYEHTISLDVSFRFKLSKTRKNS